MLLIHITQSNCNWLTRNHEITHSYESGNHLSQVAIKGRTRMIMFMKDAIDYRKSKFKRGGQKVHRTVCSAKDTSRIKTRQNIRCPMI